MASKEQILKNPNEVNADIVKVSENNCVPVAIANGTDKLQGFEKKEPDENHVGHRIDSVSLQAVKILSESKDIIDEQAKIRIENKILVESSKGKYEWFFWH